MINSNRQIRINDLMENSGVKFGTSGARGRVEDMTDEVCYAYTRAFLQHMEQHHGARKGSQVAIAGDLRPSSPRIMAAAALAIRDAGYVPLNCGFIPSPAVALHGFMRRIPSLMVTGSHIPDDRNGIKFNTPTGEVLKQDEEGIRAQTIAIPTGRFAADGSTVEPEPLPPVHAEAGARYVRRYLDFFPAGCLQRQRIGVYEHSSVARDVLSQVLSGLGADIVSLGRSDVFIPVDTEAIRPEDIALAKAWAADIELDAIVSADGDGDRPLVGDESGQWLRGDIAGILCARYLGISSVVTPVSSNTAVEKSGFFREVVRTRIGSPFVIEGMASALGRGAKSVAGYEANGGFLLASSVELENRVLDALPTRDAIIVAVSILRLASAQGTKLSSLAAMLPARFTASERVKNFTTEASAKRIATLRGKTENDARSNIEAVFGVLCGKVADIDNTDGLRITFVNNEIIHLRPSGNAPEFRCYNEADTPERTQFLNDACMQILESWKLVESS